VIPARNNIYLAPMAGVTDLAFRQIAIEQGAGFTYTEMVSAKGLEYGSERTASLLSPAENEDIFGVQLFASDPDAIVFSIQQVYKAFPARLCVIDLNMGCPAPKITGGIAGCALMRDLPLAERLIRAAVNASPLPVTVKFRKGWDDTSVNAVEFAKMAQDAGASALTVHGRTRMQFYGGKADWDIIAQVKQAVSIPVTGNGDIFCAQDALDMFSRTGCDAVMVARGSLGNPFIFREILHLMRTGEALAPAAPRERMETLVRQARIAVEAKGERIAIRQMRKHAAWYFKGFQGAGRLREAAVRLETLDDLLRLTDAFTSEKGENQGLLQICHDKSG
jgi:nifR3 family TIM-barrel protein